ncbi:MAG: hypothetical protein CENE_00015 [Candidatus Celerinatantimonas neptuna]|nr:MAG: hypothetical protein CENE_00015 [Candidatus Celerinatantimonas neptuna]
MPRGVPQGQKIDKSSDYQSALAQWEQFKPPYGSSHIKNCGTAAKIILDHTGQRRLEKYETSTFLRIVFSSTGMITIYSRFPKKMGLKNRKLGTWPELSLQLAREKAAALAAGGLRSDAIEQVLAAYQEDLQQRVQRNRLSPNSYYTYSVRIKHIHKAFVEREVFADVTYQRLIEVIDHWIQTESNNQAYELFGELRRVWEWASPIYANGHNVAAAIPAGYVSQRVERPLPTRLYTDIESIAQLWINVAGCTSVHQKNAVRYMIIYGLRPINVVDLKWEWVADDLSEIVYPAGIPGLRGAMKTNKEFRIPVTDAAREILLEQKQWAQSVPNANRDYVFLQPRDPSRPFSKRSLDKIIKARSPEGAVKGIKHDGTIKGSAGAFNTMCRKFLKSNVMAQMRRQGYSRADTREISKLCMHHSDKERDPMAEHYDFLDEITHEEMELKRIAFNAHEQSILSQVAISRD